MKVDLLVISAHPDDAELNCGGTILSCTTKGKKVGIIDLTAGELGTRGTPEIRAKEAAEAANILKVAVRENMGFRDGFFRNDEKHQLELIKKIRKYQPDLVITNAPFDRHPDHARGASLVEEACFYAGLRKIETQENGINQEAWRPNAVFNYIQYYHLNPDFVVDIAPYVELKLEAIKAFKSQFYDSSSSEPETILTQSGFFDMLKARWREMGVAAHLQFAEGFLSKRKLAVDDIFKFKFEGFA